MKIRIEEDVYEGLPSEIMERLRDQSFNADEFADLDGYMRYLQGSFQRLTEMPCELPEGSTDIRARALLERLAEIDALEILEDA